MPENEQRAFGWPKGTVRAVALFALVGGTVYSGVALNEMLLTALAGPTGIVLGFYFKREGGQ